MPNIIYTTEEQAQIDAYKATINAAQVKWNNAKNAFNNASFFKKFKLMYSVNNAYNELQKANHALIIYLKSLIPATNQITPVVQTYNFNFPPRVIYFMVRNINSIEPMISYNYMGRNYNYVFSHRIGKMVFYNLR